MERAFRMQTSMNTQVSGATLDEIRAKARAEVARFFPKDIIPQVMDTWTIGTITPVPTTSADGDAVRYVALITCTINIDPS